MYPRFWLRAKVACAWHTIRLHRNVQYAVHKNDFFCYFVNFSFGFCFIQFVYFFFTFQQIFSIWCYEQPQSSVLAATGSTFFLKKVYFAGGGVVVVCKFCSEIFRTYIYTILWPRFAQVKNAFLTMNLKNRIDKWWIFWLHFILAKKDEQNKRILTQSYKYTCRMKIREEETER